VADQSPPPIPPETGPVGERFGSVPADPQITGQNPLQAVLRGSLPPPEGSQHLPSRTVQPKIPGGLPASPGYTRQQVDPLAAQIHHSDDLKLIQRATQRRRTQVFRTVLFSVVGLAVIIAIFVILIPTLTENNGTIEVISVPAGGKVTLNGKTLSHLAPVVIPVRDIQRSHRITVTLEKYQKWSTTVKLKKDNPKERVLAVLTSIYGKLEVDSKPQGAEIYINGEHRGQTPSTIGNLVPTEDVNLELRRRGFKPATATIKWEGQTYRKIDITLHSSQ
jgi:hypothetical protein